MKKLTREQIEAVKRVYDRTPVYGDTNRAHQNQNIGYYGLTQKPNSYLQFRRSVQRGYDCIMVPWCGMWLGIEQDGYTHS